LKGALMLRVWRAPELRPTMDIDMLARTSNEEADIIARIRDTCRSRGVRPPGMARPTSYTKILRRRSVSVASKWAGASSTTRPRRRA
ncbi:MAG TPA: hypothetical protein ENK19_04565, partial [Acidobacteria bacterium]|nr:hypothetical protein [Acidobacteriota bacterium]